MLAEFQKNLFGSSSEKSRYVLNEDEQLNLLNEEEAEANVQEPEPTLETVTYKRERKPIRTKEELAENLPVPER